MSKVAKIGLVFLLSACTAGNKEKNAALTDKQAALEKLKGDQSKLNGQIGKLEKEIAELNPNASAKPKLVSAVEITPQSFQHYIELQGTIDADNISYIAPRNGQGGYVKQIFIQEGQYVKKGQLILKLDDAVLRQTLEATKSQLSFAKNIYQRQKNLWDQNIGSEVQLISAKNNVDALEKQLAVQEEQIRTFTVYSDVNGIAEQVSVKAGEFFQGATPLGPQIKIVNNSTLKLKIDVPENYISKVSRGSAVLVHIPSLNRSINTTISLISQSVNPVSRSFTAECKIPGGADIKPNMVAVAKILDHAANNTMVVPANTVQSDENGKYVYILEKTANNKMVAHRKSVTVGEVSGEVIEIRSGLENGVMLITQGYQSLYEGQLVTTSTN
jgi:membrane fusion protein, multidrug efflux system